MPGLQFCPIYGADGINFKLLYCDPRLDEMDRKYLLMILHKVYVISHEIYDILTSPDIDIDEFVQVIMSSVDDVRKQIPRCDAAFNKIVESVDLLRNNFGDYYKDFVSSNNSAVIMENFIIDVSQRTEATPKLTAQFRKIISHYRKLASQKNNNPKLQMLFKHIDKNFQELEKYTSKKDKQAEAEAEAEVDAEADVDADVDAEAEADVEPEAEVKDDSEDERLTEIPLDDEAEKPDIVLPPYGRSPQMISIKEPASPMKDSDDSSGDSDYDKLLDAPLLEDM
jgi:hypothetical protein